MQYLLNNQAKRIVKQSQDITTTLLQEQRTLLHLQTEMEIHAQLINQARQLCTDRPARLIEALTHLSPAFTDAVTRYTNFVYRLGGSDGEIQPLLLQVVSIQDAIRLALQGDGGAALNTINWPERMNFDYQINPPGRPAGMSEERQELAKLARGMRKQQGGNWWAIAKKLLQRYEAAPQRNLNEEWAYNRLMEFCAHDEKGNWYVAEKRAVGRFLSDLVQEYQNCCLSK